MGHDVVQHRHCQVVRQKRAAFSEESGRLAGFRTQRPYKMAVHQHQLLQGNLPEPVVMGMLSGTWLLVNLQMMAFRARALLLRSHHLPDHLHNNWWAHTLLAREEKIFFTAVPCAGIPPTAAKSLWKRAATMSAAQGDILALNNSIKPSCWSRPQPKPGAPRALADQLRTFLHRGRMPMSLPYLHLPLLTDNIR